MNIKKFDIVLASLPSGIGSEQEKLRPCVIIQNNKGNMYSPTTLIMPLTTVVKNTYLSTHKVIKAAETVGLKNDSMLLGEQMRVIDKRRIKSKIGEIISDNAKCYVKQCFEATW